ncbi:MAG: FtsX-like permease family protein [Mariniblastus sp.]|nr:FtsX-like permease family protein [Mariniblastus sp.]
MYKLLLSWRYLRTRFIALASIVSVTLGVATLIVVNSVMAGFVDQMKDRLHGILSDVEIAAPLLGEIAYPEKHVEIVKQVVGDDLDELTCVVRNPALLSFDFRGRQVTQQVMLLGIDDETFGKVTDFEPYLQSVIKKDRFSFKLENSGHEELFDEGSWDYRRRMIENKRRVKEWEDEQRKLVEVATATYSTPLKTTGPAKTDSAQDEASTTSSNQFQFTPLPDKVPDLNTIHSAQAPPSDPTMAVDSLEDANQITGQPKIHSMSPFDPGSAHRPQIAPEQRFDGMRDQRVGIILGKAISARKSQSSDGELHDLFMVRPGDDVQVMFPTVGMNARPVSENCTVVDFYASEMHEYDSTFAFMPLSELQKIRGMVDPMTGDGTVSAIQIKLKPGADPNKVRDKLMLQFPIEHFSYDIRTWQDTQRPLLSAVNMELTILNILLFLIIAVAGFGILATFYMIVVEKTKDIGILKALGAPSRGVMSIFLGYGLSLGTVGTGAGIILGLVFVEYINDIADLVGWLTGQEIFDPTIYYFSEIPAIINPVTICWVALGAIMIAVMASVLPALRAARLHPVEALRYE